ncbi:MAG TPA: hypothetical protein VIH37_12665 [Candidatus Limnocylindrales bacterium]
MQHSLAALRAAWPARFVHPSPRARERRLGLGTGPRFVPAPSRHTVLRHTEMGPLTELRATWRTPVIEADRAAALVRPRQAVTMSWTRAGHGVRPRRASVAPAWRA